MSCGVERARRWKLAVRLCYWYDAVAEETFEWPLVHPRLGNATTTMVRLITGWSSTGDTAVEQGPPRESACYSACQHSVPLAWPQDMEGWFSFCPWIKYDQKREGEGT
jgi:hypothetical protein